MPAATHLQQHRGAERKREHSQKLVRDAEDRPERVDAAERIGHALIEEVAPGGDEDAAGEQDGGIPGDSTERRPEVLAQVLEHEAADARARVERGEDEQRLEHDGEVIPEGHDGLASAGLHEDLRHAQGDRCLEVQRADTLP